MHSKLIVILSFLLVTIAKAQIQKGSLLTGGNFSFYHQNDTEEFSKYGNTSTDDIKSNYIFTNPQIGFFISDKTLIGGGISYEHNTLEQIIRFGGSTGTIKQRDNTFFINPYLTRYTELTEKLYLTTSINLMVGLGNGKYGENYDLKTNILDIRFNIKPGLTYAISEKWLLSANIGQLFYDWKNETVTSDTGSEERPANSSNNYGINFRLNTYLIGFQYILNN